MTISAKVNHSHARAVSSDEETNSRIYQQRSGSDNFADRRFATIEKAYELGLVDRSGILIASFQT